MYLVLMGRTLVSVGGAWGDRRNFLWLGCQISLGEGGVCRNLSLGALPPPPATLVNLGQGGESQFHGDKVISRPKLLAVTGLSPGSLVSPTISAGNESLWPLGTKSFLSWVTCFTWVSLTGSSYSPQYLSMEESLAQQGRSILPLVIYFWQGLSRSPLPEVVKGTPMKSTGKNELVASLARWEVGKCQFWVALSLFFFFWLGDSRYPASVLFLMLWVPKSPCFLLSIL